jgi:signal transduction histidine kinase
MPRLSVRSYLFILLLLPFTASVAQPLAHDSLQLALNAHPDRDTVRINLLNQLARAYFTKNPTLTQKYSEEAIALCDSLKYAQGKIWAIRNLSLVENSKGNLDKQMELSFTALFLADSLGDLRALGIINNDIGNVFTEQENPRQALKYLKKALFIKQQQQESLEIARTYNNIGSSYMRLEMQDSALYFFRQSERIKLKLNDRRGLAVTYENMGLIYFLRQQYAEALSFQEQAAEYYRESENLQGLTKAYLNMGQAQTMLKDFTSAEKSLAAAASLNATLKNVKNEMIYYKNRSQLDSARKDFSAALAHYKEFAFLNEDFFNVQKTKLIANTQQKYESEKKERENEMLKKEQLLHLATIKQQWALVFGGAFLLFSLFVVTVVMYRLYRRQQELYRQLNSKSEEVSLQNQIILEQNATLESLNGVKDKIFSAISHDLRSPMAILEGMLFLLRDDNITPEQFRYYTDELWRDMKNTAYMMDNLLQWASNQMKGIGVKADDFDITVLMKEEFELLKTLARQKDLQLVHQLNNPVMVYADPDMIRLVIRNLINNAIKFTPQGGIITVSGKCDTQMIELCIQDTGVGIASENMNRIFSNIYYSTVGTQNEKGCGLGLHLSKDFVERNHGKIWFISKAGKGTCFYFTIPLAEETENITRPQTVLIQQEEVMVNKATVRL